MWHLDDTKEWGRISILESVVDEVCEKVQASEEQAMEVNERCERTNKMTRNINLASNYHKDNEISKTRKTNEN